MEIDAGAVDRLQVHQVLLVVEKHSSEWPVRSVWLEGVGRVRVTELKVKTAIAQIESEDSQSKIRKGDVVVALPVSKRLSSREPTTSNDHAGVLISLLLDHDQYSEDQLKANVNRTGIEIHTSEEDAPLAPFDDPQIIENCELISFKEVERDGTPFWSVTLAVPQTEENSEANRELTQQRIDDLVAAGTTFLLKNLQSAKGSIRSL